MLGAAVPVVELTIWPTALAGHEHLAAVVIGAIAALPTLLRAWTSTLRAGSLAAAG